MQVKRWWARLAPCVAAAAVTAGCSVNPATGERELSLVSEAEEIAIGRDADPGIVGGGELPTWLSTHPPPENRSVRLEEQIAAAGPLPQDLEVERSGYLDRLDGMVFGADPRHGYFYRDTFYHPDLRFRFDAPTGWARTNTRQAVSLTSSGQDAVIRLTLAAEQSAGEAD